MPLIILTCHCALFISTYYYFNQITLKAEGLLWAFLWQPQFVSIGRFTHTTTLEENNLNTACTQPTSTLGFTKQLQLEDANAKWLTVQCCAIILTI